MSFLKECKQVTHLSSFASLTVLVFLVWSPTTTIGNDNNNPDVMPGCRDKCGNVSVPYPFGIDSPHCAVNNHFLLTCNKSNGEDELLFGNITALNISVPNGTITLSIAASYDCYKSGTLIRYFSQFIRLGSGPFTFSDTRNKFTAFGCDTSAVVSNDEGTYGAACLSLCENATVVPNKSSCLSGSGCCQTSIPPGLKSIYITISSIYNHTNFSDANPCGFAFLADQHSFEVSDWKLSDQPFKWTDVVVEWVVQTETCDDATAHQSSYACGNNTNCSYSDSGGGYRCACKEGFTGNPYMREGCRDIDECKYPDIYPCRQGTCKNKPGNYICQCPLGMHGDGKIGCQGFRITTVAAVVGATVFFAIICVLLYIMWRRRKKEKNFRENGGSLLKHQRVRIFSEAELIKATKNYDASRFLGEGGFGSVYKGVLSDSTEIAVKKPKGLDKAQINQEFHQEIGIVTQVNHKNVVKILGLCLETTVPLLVYEFVSNGTLSRHIHGSGGNSSPILATWRNRLKIAAETALALDYLHSLADPPIIHGDIKSANILLDGNYTAKVSDFGASVLVSPYQTDKVTKIKGTFGYLDPEYLLTGELTAKSDVYSFGVVLVELLTGLRPNSSVARSGKQGISFLQYFLSALKTNGVSEILNFQVNSYEEMEEIEDFAELARQCLSSSGMERPNMKRVAMELGRMLEACQNLGPHQGNSEETQHLLAETSCCTATTFSVTTFDIENNVDSN